MSIRDYLGVLVLVCMAIWLTYAIVINPFLISEKKSPEALEEEKTISISEIISHSSSYLKYFKPLFKEILSVLNGRGVKVSFSLDRRNSVISFFDNNKLLLNVTSHGEVGIPCKVLLSNVSPDYREVIEKIFKDKPNLLDYHYSFSGNNLKGSAYLEISP